MYRIDFIECNYRYVEVVAQTKKTITYLSLNGKHKTDDKRLIGFYKFVDNEVEALKTLLRYLKKLIRQEFEVYNKFSRKVITDLENKYTEYMNKLNIYSNC